MFVSTLTRILFTKSYYSQRKAFVMFTSATRLPSAALLEIYFLFYGVNETVYNLV